MRIKRAKLSKKQTAIQRISREVEVEYCFRKTNRYGQKNERVRVTGYVNKKKNSCYLVERNGEIYSIPTKYIDKQQREAFSSIRLPVSNPSKPAVVTKPKGKPHTHSNPKN